MFRSISFHLLIQFFLGTGLSVLLREQIGYEQEIPTFYIGRGLGGILFPLIVISIPAGIYWLIKKKRMPGFIIVLWVLWTVLMSMATAGNILVQREHRVQKQIELAIANIDTPVMIDPETRMDSVKFKNGNSIIFTYSLINQSAGGFDRKGFAESMANQRIESTMSNQLATLFYDMGVALDHYYVDRNGNYITNIVIEKNPQSVTGGYR